MPARRIGPAIAAAMALLLTGCGLPDGVDGDLTGGWGVMREPVVFAPEPGTCHYQIFGEVVTLGGYRPVDCDDGFRFETVHVGTFSGDAAERVTPPPEGSPELQEAYQECDEAAADYLGADFRRGRLWLGVGKPSSLAWKGGARWFRCDVGVWLDHESRHAVLIRHVGSLRDALVDDSDLTLGCYDPLLDQEEGVFVRMNPVECDQPHNAEFVGLWTAPGTDYPDIEGEDFRNRLHRGCRSAVAEFVRVPDDAEMQHRTGTIALPISLRDWEMGDRTYRCYLWLDEREVSESLKGAGTSGLPIT